MQRENTLDQAHTPALLAFRVSCEEDAGQLSTGCSLGFSTDFSTGFSTPRS